MMHWVDKIILVLLLHLLALSNVCALPLRPINVDVGLSQKYFAPPLRPVKWTAELKKIDDQTIDIIFKANIETGWAVYSQTQESKDGPLPTTFIFQKDENYNCLGAVKESWKNKKRERDPVFDMVVSKYEKEAVFTQRVQTKSAATLLIVIEYMSCRATSCLPQRYVEFQLRTRDIGRVFQPTKFIK